MIPLLTGFATGLALIILVGPVFFLLLRVTLERGRVAGVCVAMGIFISDLAAVLLIYYGFSALFTSADFQRWSALVGAVLISALGVSYIIRPGLPKTSRKKTGLKNIFSAFL
ncbi:LysE family transporter, partial [Myxococcota bacterium]|nr:LysE family transporter [Myxococcota bacterium]